MTDDPALMTATALLGMYRRKTLSPVEATEAALKRIDDHDERLNAFIIVDHEGALERARQSEARWARGEPQGLIDGVPVTIKDLVITEKWPTKRGSLTAPVPPGEDAPCVARLTEHGAVPLGKTTTPEFGWKGVTDSPLTGITRNPWNAETTPGGSSGGAAIAAACGMGALHIGSDGGGSIRIPAGFTGVFGLKPSFGRVPVYPPSPMGTLTHVGPMTRTVTDAALMLTIMSEPDARDWFALPYDARDYRVGLDDGVAGLRIAFSPDLGHAQVDADVAERVDEAVKVLAELGAHVEPVDLDLSETPDIFRIHWYAGAARAFSLIAEGERELLEEGFREVAAEGRTYDALTYLNAINDRTALGIKLNALHQDFDLLLTPTLPIPAFTAGEEVADAATQKRWTEWTPFSYPFNMTQQPAATIPCGLTASGLPVGLQVIGARYAEALVLRACRAYETACPIRLPEIGA